MITCASAMLPSQDTWNAYMSKLDAMVESGSISAEKALAIIQSNDLDLILRKEEKASIPPDYSDNDIIGVWKGLTYRPLVVSLGATYLF